MATELPQISKPATQSLKSIGATTLEEVSQYKRTTLLGIHGVGPKTIEILQQTLKENGLDFADDQKSDLPFEFIGDLNCDNAPKRRIMLDFLIGCTLVDKEKLLEVVTENFIWEVPSAFQLKGIDAFYDELNKHKVDITSLEITHNITHGKIGAMHGTQKMENGETIYFADFLEFESHSKNAKLKKVVSYVIMNEGES